MLEGKLLFVEQNRIVGESKNGPYDFTNVSVSDGFKTIELSTDKNFAEKLPTLNLKKGDQVQVTVDYKRTRFVITDLKKVG